MLQTDTQVQPISFENTASPSDSHSCKESKESPSISPQSSDSCQFTVSAKNQLDEFLIREFCAKSYNHLHQEIPQGTTSQIFSTLDETVDKIKQYLNTIKNKSKKQNEVLKIALDMLDEYLKITRSIGHQHRVIVENNKAFFSSNRTIIDMATNIKLAKIIVYLETKEFKNWLYILRKQYTLPGAIRNYQINKPCKDIELLCDKWLEKKYLTYAIYNEIKNLLMIFARTARCLKDMEMQYDTKIQAIIDDIFTTPSDETAERQLIELNKKVIAYRRELFTATKNKNAQTCDLKKQQIQQNIQRLQIQLHAQEICVNKIKKTTKEQLLAELQKPVTLRAKQISRLKYLKQTIKEHTTKPDEDMMAAQIVKCTVSLEALANVISLKGYIQSAVYKTTNQEQYEAFQYFCNQTLIKMQNCFEKLKLAKDFGSEDFKEQFIIVCNLQGILKTKINEFKYKKK